VFGRYGRKEGDFRSIPYIAGQAGRETMGTRIKRENTY
jgi:hypothetical protein